MTYIYIILYQIVKAIHIYKLTTLLYVYATLFEGTTLTHYSSSSRFPYFTKFLNTSTSQFEFFPISVRFIFNACLSYSTVQVTLKFEYGTNRGGIEFHPIFALIVL